MDHNMLLRLRESIGRFGMIQNLVVRPIEDDVYEVLSGNQRLQVLKELGAKSVPCAVVELGDAEARLLAQALNRIQGTDDLGLKAELIREILKTLPASELMSVLPESASSLEALSSLGQQDIAEQLKAWEKARTARLHHVIFQLSKDQVETVEEAMERAMARSTPDGSNPNRKGHALYLLCRDYLEAQDEVLE